MSPDIKIMSYDFLGITGRVKLPIFVVFVCNSRHVMNYVRGSHDLPFPSNTTGEYFIFSRSGTEMMTRTRGEEKEVVD